MKYWPSRAVSFILCMSIPIFLLKRQGDRFILVKLLVGDLIFNVISAYAPQIGRNESVKMQF
jgi:hypothetical protein